jgi:hypothetical protein
MMQTIVLYSDTFGAISSLVFDEFVIHNYSVESSSIKLKLKFDIMLGLGILLWDFDLC